MNLPTHRYGSERSDSGLFHLILNSDSAMNENRLSLKLYKYKVFDLNERFLQVCLCFIFVLVRSIIEGREQTEKNTFKCVHGFLSKSTECFIKKSSLGNVSHIVQSKLEIVDTNYSWRLSRNTFHDLLSEFNFGKNQFLFKF